MHVNGRKSFKELKTRLDLDERERFGSDLILLNNARNISTMKDLQIKLRYTPLKTFKLDVKSITNHSRRNQSEMQFIPPRHVHPLAPVQQSAFSSEILALPLYQVPWQPLLVVFRTVTMYTILKPSHIVQKTEKKNTEEKAYRSPPAPSFGPTPQQENRELTPLLPEVNYQGLLTKLHIDKN